MFNLLGRAVQALKVTDPKAWNPSLWRLAGFLAESGETVTEDTALTYSAVWNAVNIYAGTISTLPLHLKGTEGKKTKNVKEHPLYNVLHTVSNPYMPAHRFRSVMMAHILLWGNGYAEIVRDPGGRVVSLWPITPNRVSVGMRNGAPYYVISMGPNEPDVTLPWENVLHIPGLGFDGMIGYSVVSMGRRSIGLGMAMESFGSQFFGSGTHPGLVVSHPQVLSEDGHKNLSWSLSQQYSGLGNSHRLMLLEEGMKVEKIGVSPEDSQFLESRQFQIPEIARWFNLPPHKLKDLTRSSFNNIESEQISFVTDSILPWLLCLEQNYDLQLLSEKDRKAGLHTRHNVDGLLRGNPKDRAEYYRTMFAIGAFSINMILEKEEMDLLDDNNADEHFVPLNMIPLSMMDKYLEMQKNGKSASGVGAPQLPGPSNPKEEE